MKWSVLFKMLNLNFFNFATAMLFFLCSCLVCAQVRPVGMRVLTIEQAVSESIENNLGVLAERANIPVAEATIIAAGLKPNPVLSLGADHLNVLGPVYNTTNNAGPNEINARIDFLIERAHKREYRLETALFNRQIAEARLAEAIRNLRITVISGCIDLIQAKANLALALELLKNYEELFQINETRVNAGSVSPLELVRAKVAMLQFRNQVQRAQLGVMRARTRLQGLLGPQALAQAIDVSGELKVRLAPAGMPLEKLQQLAIESRPELETVRLTQMRSAADLKLQLANGKVDYTYGTEYRRQQGVNGTSNSLGVFVSIPIPVNNKNQGEIARVEAERRLYARQLEALSANTRNEVRAAYEVFESSRELVESIERDLLDSARKVRDTAGYVYRAGASSLLEFLDAQRALNESMQSYQEALGDYRRSVVNLNASVNKEIIE